MPQNLWWINTATPAATAAYELILLEFYLVNPYIYFMGPGQTNVIVIISTYNLKRT